MNAYLWYLLGVVTGVCVACAALAEHHLHALQRWAEKDAKADAKFQEYTLLTLGYKEREAKEGDAQ